MIRMTRWASHVQIGGKSISGRETASATALDRNGLSLFKEEEQRGLRGTMEGGEVKARDRDQVSTISQQAHFHLKARLPV